MSRIIKMVDEIKEYYNLNDTLLASDLGIMQQTIRGWRDGRQPTLPNYNKVKAMYDKMQQEAVDNSIVQRFEALEEKVEKKPYEVEVPDDLEDLYYVDETGLIGPIYLYDEDDQEKVYKRGLALKTKEEAKRYDKKRILINKMEEWAKEHQGDWTPNWKDLDETIHEVQIDRFPMYACDSPLVINEVEEVRSASIFPYFYSYETAREFIDEFRGEIEEVFC